MSKTYSRRAEILKRVLDWINRASYSDFGRFMVFGEVNISWEGDDKSPEEVYLHLEDSVSETKDSKALHEIMEALRQLEVDLDRDRARQLAQERTSLTRQQGPTAESFIDRWQTAMENLSPQAKTLLRKRPERALEENPERIENADQQEATATDDLSELLDWYHSEEVLAKLEKIVRRASALDRVEAAKIPSESVEKYFEEAHRCFLYGFPIATATLCRAILESRLLELRQILDPNGRIKREIEGVDAGKRPSYLKALINQAAAEGLLENGRGKWDKKKIPHWAEEIIDAGNWAVHDLPKFNKKYSGDKGASNLKELMQNNRKALIELLTKQKGEQGA